MNIVNTASVYSIPVKWEKNRTSPQVQFKIVKRSKKSKSRWGETDYSNTDEETEKDKSNQCMQK